MIEEGQEVTWEDLFEALHGLHPRGLVGWYRVTERDDDLRVFTLCLQEPITAPERDMGFSYAFSPLDRDYHVEEGTMRSLFAFPASEKARKLCVGQALWFLDTFQRLRPSLFAFRPPQERPRDVCPICSFPLESTRPPGRPHRPGTAPSPLRR